MAKHGKTLVMCPEKSIMTVQSEHKTSTYALERLPSKLKVWLKYAANFLRVLHSKTPWHSYNIKDAKDEGFSELYFDVFYNYDSILDATKILNANYLNQIHFISKDRVKTVSVANTADGLLHIKSG